MARRRLAGRGETPRAVGRVAGRVRSGPVIGRVSPIEQARTDIAPLDELPPPVFADPNGLRRRRLRRLAYAFVLLLVLLLASFWMSQLGMDLPGIRLE
ncbi:hypothetical protein AB0F81_13120 [Actinoplanes sp. NPDC024001]|uniref:hypothetical protein n=1 Tax=Actinoplanes sp. NPDC024001 TaxID=3154598 RepID=UPI0033E386C9